MTLGPLVFIFIATISPANAARGVGATGAYCNLTVSQISNSSSSPTEIYSNLIRSLAEKNAFSDEDLKTLSSQPEPVNPFDITSPSLTLLNKFAYKEAFQKILKSSQKKPLDWPKIQETLRELISKKNVSEIHKAQAHEATATLLYPHLVFQKYITGPAKKLSGPFDIIYKEGQPFIVGQLNEKARLLDPRTEAVTRITENGAQNNYGIRGYFEGQSPELIFKLVENDNILGEFQGYGMGTFSINDVAGRHVLSYIHRDAGVAFFYDLDLHKPFPRISANIRGMVDQNNHAAVYEDSGKLRAFFPTLEHYVVADLENGKIIQSYGRPGFVHGQPHVTRDGDRLMAYGKGKDSLEVIDLSAKTSTKIASHNMSGEVVEFSFNNEKYLVWGTTHGKITIYNLTQNAMVSSKNILTEKIDQIVPYEQDGNIYAFVDWGWGGRPPAIIQLAGPINEKR